MAPHARRRPARRRAVCAARGRARDRRVCRAPRGRDVCAGRGEHRWRRCRGTRKVEKYSCGQAGGGYDFEPVIVETYGRLCEPALELLARLARVAAESGKVDEGKFIENTLKEMSVALCRGNGSILQRVRRCWRR